MGRRGPAPQPTRLRLLHGVEDRYINHNEPQPGVGLPEAPDEMDDASHAIWDYILAELDVMGLATRPDRDQLFAYCEAVRLHAQAVAMVHRAGPLIKDRDDYVRLNPAVRVMHQAARTMLLFAREFGLTPAARVHLTAQKVAEDHAERLLS